MSRVHSGLAFVFWLSYMYTTNALRAGYTRDQRLLSAFHTMNSLRVGYTRDQLLLSALNVYNEHSISRVPSGSAFVVYLKCIQ